MAMTTSPDRSPQCSVSRVAQTTGKHREIREIREIHEYREILVV